MIVANVSPSSVCAQETLSTLYFARRAKHIRNRATVNVDVRGDAALLQREIQRCAQDPAERAALDLALRRWISRRSARSGGARPPRRRGPPPRLGWLAAGAPAGAGAAVPVRGGRLRPPRSTPPVPPPPPQAQHGAGQPAQGRDRPRGRRVQEPEAPARQARALARPRGRPRRPRPVAPAPRASCRPRGAARRRRAARRPPARSERGVREELAARLEAAANDNAQLRRERKRLDEKLAHVHGCAPPARRPAGGRARPGAAHASAKERRRG